MNILSVENIKKSFGARTLFEEISFGLAEGEKAALVARNGRGKTTLLEILAGEETADQGRVVFRKGLKVEYLTQEPHLPKGQTVLKQVLQADNPMTQAIVQYEEALDHPEDSDRYQKAFESMERLQAWDYEAQVKQILSQLGIADTGVQTDHFSGGQKKRVALAKVLISQPELLILDEPTNHLDLEMVEWLEDYLSNQRMALLMVSHDRYFLEKVCSKILELDDSGFYSHPGKYSAFLERKADREDAAASQVSRAKNLLRKELEWMRRQPKARGTKSKARQDQFYNLKDQAQAAQVEGEVQMDIKMTRMGSKILELHRIKKSYGERKLVDSLDYTFKRGDRIGVVGPNGTGKSTLLKIITGNEEPSGGKVVVGDTIRFGYYRQEGMRFKEDERVIDVIKNIAEYIPVGRKGRKITASQMLERFLFEGDQQYNLVRKLSGGEKRRLYLLTILMDNPNFLILDEPTNDLDILTLNVLEDFLLEFDGCLLIVTHDRYFMDKLTEHLFVFEGDGHIRDFPGNYTDYREAKAAAAQTEKLRQKSLAKAPKNQTDPKAGREKTKLTYAEKLELQELEDALETLEAEKERLAGAFHKAADDADKLAELSQQMEQLQSEMEQKEERWLELSELGG